MPLLFECTISSNVGTLCQKLKMFNAWFWHVPQNGFWRIFSMLLDWPFLPKWRWKQFCCNYFDVEPRKCLDWLDYSTTVAGNKKSPKMHAWKCLKKTSRHSATKHPTAWRPVLWRSRYYVSIKFDFSLLLQYWFLKIHHRLFFSLSRRYLTFLVFQ